MIKLVKYFLFFLIIGSAVSEEKPVKINIIGKVLNKNVKGLKGVKLVIEDNDGKNFGKERSGRNGDFTFKKLKLFPGEYLLRKSQKRWPWRS